MPVIHKDHALATVSATCSLHVSSVLYPDVRVTYSPKYKTALLCSPKIFMKVPIQDMSKFVHQEFLPYIWACTVYVSMCSLSYFCEITGPEK